MLVDVPHACAIVPRFCLLSAYFDFLVKLNPNEATKPAHSQPTPKKEKDSSHISLWQLIAGNTLEGGVERQELCTHVQL